MAGFQFGSPKVNVTSVTCCGKPRGCDMTHDGCLYLHHPWKRAIVFGDTTVQCQAMGLELDGRRTQCVLLHGHSGGHAPKPVGV